jgi:hypothetical protein
MIAVLLFALLNPIASYAQNFNKIGFMAGPSSFFILGATPVFSQSKISSAGYSGWGYNFQGAFQFELLGGVANRVHFAYQRIVSDNTQNTTTNHEETTSSSVELGTCFLMFERLCLGGGVQSRSIDVEQATGTTLSSENLSGWAPFGRLSFDLLGADAQYGISPTVSYHSGQLSSRSFSEIQVGLQINVLIPVK